MIERNRSIRKRKVNISMFIYVYIYIYINTQIYHQTKTGILIRYALMRGTGKTYMFFTH